MNNPNNEKGKQNQEREQPSDRGFYSREVFTKLVMEAFDDALDRYNHPTQQDVADIMKISRPTLCRYLKKYISWRKVQDDGRVFRSALNR